MRSATDDAFLDPSVDSNLLAVNPLSVTPVNEGLSDTPTPSDVLAVLPLSVMKFVPFPIIMFPSAGVNPATSANC